MTNRHGGLRSPSGGRPRKAEHAPKKEYLRLPVELPAPGDEREETAAEWWDSLSPAERLVAIVKMRFS